jgi:hypothetical protein
MLHSDINATFIRRLGSIITEDDRKSPCTLIVSDISPFPFPEKRHRTTSAGSTQMIHNTDRLSRLYPVLTLVALSIGLTSVAHTAIRQTEDGKVPTRKLSEKPTGFTALSEWLVAGPFPSPDISSTITSDRPTTDMTIREYLEWQATMSRVPHLRGYSTDYLKELGGELKARPREGTKVKDPDGETVIFRSYKWDTDYIDLTEIFGRPSRVCAYIYSEVKTTEKMSLYIHAGSNDASKLWVNGKLVVENAHDSQARRSEQVVRVKMKKGRNAILMKIDQLGAGWGAYVELSDKPYRAHRRYNIVNRNVYRPRSNGSLTDLLGGGSWGVPIAVILVFGLIAVVLLIPIPLAIVLYYRNKRNLADQQHKLFIAMVEQGMEPDPSMLDRQTEQPVRSSGRQAWGLALFLGGLALTITEIARSGFANAGFEMAIMLVGLGLASSGWGDRGIQRLRDMNTLKRDQAEDAE